MVDIHVLTMRADERRAIIWFLTFVIISLDGVRATTIAYPGLCSPGSGSALHTFYASVNSSGIFPILEKNYYNCTNIEQCARYCYKTNATCMEEVEAPPNRYVYITSLELDRGRLVTTCCASAHLRFDVCSWKRLTMQVGPQAIKFQAPTSRGVYRNLNATHAELCIVSNETGIPRDLACPGGGFAGLTSLAALAAVCYPVDDDPGFEAACCAPCIKCFICCGCDIGKFGNQCITTSFINCVAASCGGVCPGCC